MAWRLAKSLLTLVAQINAAAPKRNKSSDGTIGDDSHATRTSDHNPWVRDGATGVVTAIDITHDPRNGVDTYELAERLRRNRDPRIKYVISNRRIFNQFTAPWAWRSYSGANPHSAHVHISVRSEKAEYDRGGDWDIGALAPSPAAPPVLDKPLLAIGSKGEHVKYLQKLLGIVVDGIFGPITRAAVQQFQRDHRLVPDGVVGRYTWGALL